MRAAAARPKATENMDARVSSSVDRDGVPGADAGNWIELRFIDEAHGRFVEFPQGGFGRLEAREFHEVATLEKLGQAVLLVLGQHLAGLPFGEEFLGSPFGRV